MKKAKIITFLLTAALTAASLSACGADSEETIGDAPPLQEPDRGGQAFPAENETVAKVVSLDGDQLTVILADLPNRGNEGGTPPAIGGGSENSGTPAMDERPGSGGVESDDPSASGPVQPDRNTPPDGAAAPDGSVPPNGGNGPGPVSGAAIDGPGAAAGDPGPKDDQSRSGESGSGAADIEFAGEEVTYTLSGDLVIMKEMGNDAAEIDLSELAAGDVIRFSTTTGDDGNEKIDSITVME